MEGIEYFKQLFKSSDLKTVRLSLTLFETCVKNCNIHFHRYINNRDLIPYILQLLKRKRKKLNLVEKLAGLYKDSGWREIEDRVLTLVQLWADTFMMHEDKYPAFMKAYRELRQESLKFPARNPNERFMIKFDGDPSPAFELADMESQEVTHQVKELFSPSEFEVFKVNMPQLREIIANAQAAAELQTSGVKELVRKCRQAQKRLVEFVSAKSESSDTAELLEILDYVNAQMEAFKTAAKVLRKGIVGDPVRDEVRAKSSIGEDEALHKLEKFVYGHRNEQEPEEVEPQVHEEVGGKGRLHEVDLLFDMNDSLPSARQESIENTQDPPSSSIDDDLFGLNSLVIDPHGQVVQPPATQPPMSQHQIPQHPMHQPPMHQAAMHQPAMHHGMPPHPMHQMAPNPMYPPTYGQPPMGYPPGYNIPPHPYSQPVPQIPYNMPANPFASLNQQDVFSHLVNHK